MKTALSYTCRFESQPIKGAMGRLTMNGLCRDNNKCMIFVVVLNILLLCNTLDTQALNAMQYIPSSVINIRHCKKLTLFLAIKRNRIILNNSQGKIKLKKYNLFVTVMLKIQNKSNLKHYEL